MAYSYGKIAEAELLELLELWYEEHPKTSEEEEPND